MSEFEKLLRGADVQLLPLKNLATFLKGKSLPKKSIEEEGNSKCIHYGELFLQYPETIKEVKSRTNQCVSSSVLSKKNDVLMPTSDVTPSGLCVSSCINEDGVILGGDILVIRSNKINGTYLSYFIRGSKNKVLKMVKGTTVFHIYAKDIGKLEIPIPCPDDPEKSLAIQAEIVRILDTFTDLTTELEKELVAREKQYEHYRNALLDASDGTIGGINVEWLTLGEILIRTRGTKITAQRMKELHSNDAPIKIFAGGRTTALVNYGDIPEKDINTLPSIIVKSRGIIEFEYYDKPFSHKNEMWSYCSDNSLVNIKYAYYYLKENESYFRKIGGNMQMPQIATPDTEKYKIPIPCPDEPEKSLVIQEEIVRKLDKFTELNAQLTEEIELRKKQYEYYRDMLFGLLKRDNNHADTSSPASAN